MLILVVFYVCADLFEKYSFFTLFYIFSGYRVDSRQQLDQYFEIHAAKLRGDGLKAYGGKFTVDRRIMKSEHIAHSLHHV